jgi:tripartite-type tricarboxylate transporter receptor subunit TctC
MSGVFTLSNTSDAGSASTRRRIARAQDVRPTCLQGARIRWIVGWTPGGGFDTYSRLAEPFIEKVLGAQIAIDNIPGAAGRVGAVALSRARADGRTLGILSGASFLWERNSSAGPLPDLRRDFTVLARIAGRQQVILASSAAGIRSVDDLIRLGQRRAVVAGITAADSANFASLAIVTDLLGIPIEFVSGYPGSREVTLGLLRGDADIASVDVETFAQIPDLDRVQALLQITSERSPDPKFPTVPHLAGPTGLVSGRPALFAGDPDRARTLSAAISSYLEFGRLIAGPGGMTPAVRDCLEQGLRTALTDPAFVSTVRRAGRSVDFAAGADVTRAIPGVMESVRPIAAVAAAAARRIR